MNAETNPQYCGLNAIAIVLNFQDPRCSRHVQEMLHIFHGMLAGDIVKHLVLIFTRFNYYEKSRRNYAQIPCRYT